MKTSNTLAILMSLPYANCHPLTADRKGEWAVDISRNFRIIFEIADDPVPKKEDGSIDYSSIEEISIIKNRRLSLTIYIIRIMSKLSVERGTPLQTRRFNIRKH